MGSPGYSILTLSHEGPESCVRGEDTFLVSALAPDFFSFPLQTGGGTQAVPRVSLQPTLEASFCDWLASSAPAG